MLKFTKETSTLPLEELLRAWGRGALDDTQMIGHLLQHIMHMDKRILRLEQPAADNPTGPAVGSTRKPPVK